MKKKTKNRGEWSELYAFCKLMLDNRLPFGDSEGTANDKDYVTVLSLAHNHIDTIYSIKDAKKINIIKSDGSGEVEFFISEILDEDKLDEVLKDIKSGVGRTFEMKSFNQITERLDIQKFKGDSSSKADLSISYTYEDIALPLDPVGIKSFIGGAPTLLNSSAVTNFTYEIKGYKGTVADINSISSRSAVKDRVKEIISQGAKLEFVCCGSDVHEENLRKVDSLMPEMLASALLHYYSGKGNLLSELVSEEQKVIRFKEYLKAVLLGMFSSKVWDGQYTSNGTIVIQNGGSLTLFHVMKDSTLKNYLFNKTKFDTPSTTKYKFGKIYTENGKFFIKLNLQIRNI